MIDFWIRQKTKKNYDINGEIARKGKIKEFTGISDPYEEPKNAEIVINSSGNSPQKLVDEIYDAICERGYIRTNESKGIE